MGRLQQHQSWHASFQWITHQGWLRILEGNGGFLGRSVTAACPAGCAAPDAPSATCQLIIVTHLCCSWLNRSQNRQSCAVQCNAMQYTDMPCHAVPCYAVPYYAMLCHAMLCCAMLCHAMPCYAMLCYAMPCHAMLCYAMLCCAVLCYAMLCYAMLCAAGTMARCAMKSRCRRQHATAVSAHQRRRKASATTQTRRLSGACRRRP